MDFLSEIMDFLGSLLGGNKSGGKGAPTPTPTPMPSMDEYARQLQNRFKAGEISIEEADRLLNQNYPSSQPVGGPVNTFPSNTPTPATPAQSFGAPPQPPTIPQTPGVIPAGTEQAMNFIKRNTPQGSDINQYYPAFQDPEFLRKIEEADKKRQGMANLLLLQSFFESTLGRGGSGYFGAKPAGQTANFETPSSAVDYQLGPSMLSGGANPNMNILGKSGPIARDDIINLYKSYDPPGAYIDQLLPALGL